MSQDSPPCRVAAFREEQSLSQAELGRRAGLSRQLVNIIERGKAVPSVLTAVRLAEALGCSVGDLFCYPPLPDCLSVQLPAGATAGEPVRLARIGEQWVALPAFASETSGFGLADGRLITRRGRTGKVHPWAPESHLRQNLFIAGCDPALGIVRDLWGRQAAGGSVCWRNLSSGAAAEALQRGEVHAAGVHFPQGPAGDAARSALPRDCHAIRFATWEQGWMVRPGNPSGFRSVEDLASRRFRLINRPAGSGSRMLLDRLVAQSGLAPAKIPSYATIGATHAQCGLGIQEGRGDVAIGLRAIAAQHGLDFLPLEPVHFDLLVLAPFLHSPPVARLLEMLQHRPLRTHLSCLPGYETRETGRRLGLLQVKTEARPSRVRG